MNGPSCFPSIDQLEADCDEARLAVGTTINANRLDPNMDEIQAALARWRSARQALRQARPVTPSGARVPTPTSE